jgi:hypothetical protein
LSLLYLHFRFNIFSQTSFHISSPLQYFMSIRFPAQWAWQAGLIYIVWRKPLINYNKIKKYAAILESVSTPKKYFHRKSTNIEKYFSRKVQMLREVHTVHRKRVNVEKDKRWNSRTSKKHFRRKCTNL